MKYFTSFFISSALVTLLTACSAPTAPDVLPANADAYFYQQNTNYQYTYSLDNSVSTATTTFQASLVDPNIYGSYLELKDQSAANNNVLYYFKNVQSADGSIICILATSASDFGSRR